jgi:hypothetical protein
MTEYGSLLFVAVVFGVLVAFFKHLLVKVLGSVLIVTALCVLFPDLLVLFARWVQLIRQSLL